jgi:hypothetical protein
VVSLAMNVAAAWRLVAVVQSDTHDVDRLGEPLRVCEGCECWHGSVLEAHRLWAVISR